MHGSRGFSALLFNTLFLASLLTLAAALVFTGAGLAAVASIFVALPAFLLHPSAPRIALPVPARRRVRAPFPR